MENQVSSEWIERQEERRAWAIGEAVRYLKDFENIDTDTLIQVAGDIEKFVIGAEKEDPDLHDQDAIDQFFVLYAEDAKAGVDYIREVAGKELAPTDEEVVEAAENLLDKMSKNGIRLKNGEKFERLVGE